MNKFIYILPLTILLGTAANAQGIYPDHPGLAKCADEACKDALRTKIDEDILERLPSIKSKNDLRPGMRKYVKEIVDKQWTEDLTETQVDIALKANHLFTSGMSW